MNTRISDERAKPMPRVKTTAAPAESVMPATPVQAQTEAKSEWQKAIDEGVCTMDEFFDELRRHIDEHYDRLERCAKS